MKKAICWSDVHVPFQDVTAQRLLVKFLRVWQPDLVVLAGDLLDFYALSRFDRDPARRFSLADDLNETKDYLDAIDSVLCPGTRKVFVGGNHEDRLRRYLWERAPELSGIVGVEIAALLTLPARGWEYIPYYEPVATAGAPGFSEYGLLFIHGHVARKWSGYTARANFEQFNYSGVSGHSHRLGSFYHRAYGGQSVWMESGCMCNLEPPYLSYPDWQQGFVAGYVFDEEGDPKPRFDLRTVFIHKGKLAWEGALIAV